MSDQQSIPIQLIPSAVLQWVAELTNAEIVDVQARAGGGASREGAQITLRYPDGHQRVCYLTYDLRDADGSDRLVGFRAEASTLAALQATDIKVPGLLGYSTVQRAMLTDMVPGEARFDLLKTEPERRQVAHDFMRQLGQLHSLDAGSLPLDGFAPLAAPSTYIRARLAALAAKHAQATEDPLLVFALRWLNDHIPLDPPRTVLVHGDAGPANFLYADGQVTALLDWEMTHFGDPMEDLAWIAIRDLFQPFAPLPGCFAAYQEASGIAVDLERVRYHRVYNLINLVIDTHADIKQSRHAFPGILGNYLMYYTLHMRVMVEGIADAMQIELPELTLPLSEEGDNQRSFAIVLDELREQIVPRIEDPVAAHRAKSLARVVKYWQALDRHGSAFEAMERTELAAILRQPVTSVTQGRAAFISTIRTHSMDEATVIRLLHRRMQRETAMMAPAMGALARRSFAALT